MLGKQRGDRATLLYLGKTPSLGCAVGGAPACRLCTPACRVAMILTEAKGRKVRSKATRRDLHSQSHERVLSLLSSTLVERTSFRTASTQAIIARTLSSCIVTRPLNFQLSMSTCSTCWSTTSSSLPLRLGARTSSWCVSKMGLCVYALTIGN